MAQWLSWLERRPVTAEVESSSLFWVVSFYHGIIAQLGEHLPYKQRVIGSSPIGPTNQFHIDYAGVAELADAQDLKSCGTNLPYRFDSGLRHWCEVLQPLMDRGIGVLSILLEKLYKVVQPVTKRVT